jgi:DNA-binding transcriptional MerR regulator
MDPGLYSDEEAASSHDALAAIRHGDRHDPRFESPDDPRIRPVAQGYFKIGEVAKITGIKPYVLRYWEREFPWIKPLKTGTRQRRYRREDIALLLRIGRLRYEERLTIDQAREKIRETKKEEGVARAHARKKRDKIDTSGLMRSLQEMRKAVLELIEAVEE